MHELLSYIIPSWFRSSFWKLLQRLNDTMMLLQLRLHCFAVLAALLSLNTYAQSGQCPDFTSYSQVPQGNVSSGPLKLPFMRPSPECRTFTSPAVEVGDTYCYHLDNLKPTETIAASYHGYEGKA